ncbi:MAG TPA: hypothetical protein DCZ92_12810 [Elusimicrobia bacterium]|nr:MAG: hypothetical protein A2016_09435 [Elusimicrobia bacterium GWF2_62_30]HBA61669.1 hypothetical protein [Elusimicrobiota bacterium]
MKQAVLTAVLLALTSSSYAFDLQGIKAADIKNPGNSVPAASPAVSANKNYQSLWMSVYLNESFKESQASDFSQGIDVRVRKVFDTTFNVSVRAGNNYEWLSLNKFGSNFSLSGSGVNLSMNNWSGNYNVSGSVYGDDNKAQFVNLTLYKGFDGYSYSVSGFGLNLNIGRNSISGSYDDTQYSKKALAAVITLALAAQVDNTPAQKGAEEKAGERIWLSIRNDSFGGWNQVEATDPFADITVGLRRSFNRDFDAEIEVGSDRENGRVSNFFSRTWDYRSFRTSLSMDEWGGTYTLKGDLYVKGAAPEVRQIKLDLRSTFGPGQFSVYENGLRLNIDTHGVNGEVDTAVYPKKLVAIITAIAMAMQQPAQQR